MGHGVADRAHLGGIFSDYPSWRWIFLVNLPIGLAAAWMLWRRFDEKVERTRHRIDFAGLLLLAFSGWSGRRRSRSRCSGSLAAVC